MRGIAIPVLVATVIGCTFAEPRPAPLARSCGPWAHLDKGQQLQTARALVEPGLMANVRAVQHLPAGSTDAAAYAAVRSSINKVCELERQPGLLLSEILTSLYGEPRSS